MIKKILIAPHPKLRAKSYPIDPNSPYLSNLIRDLIDTAGKSQIPGLGLSAVQIGVNKRVFVANLDFPMKVKKGKPVKKISNFKVFINPEIIWSSQETNLEIIPEENLYLEGCLSVPNIYALIKRPYQIKLKWQSFKLPTSNLISNLQSLTSNLQTFEREFKGFSATLIQHEIDHLNGILFTDHALTQAATLYEDKKGELKEVVIG